MGNVPSPRCPAWCTARHATNPDLHTAVLDSFQGDEEIVTAALYQLGDAAPVLRLLVEEAGQVDFIELPSKTAASLGDIVRILGTPTVFDFAAALTRGAALLGTGKASR